MRWSMPIFALALAIALGALSPMPGQHGRSHANVTLASLGAALGISHPAEAATLVASPAIATACQPGALARQARPETDNALLWAASLRGWPEGPTVQAWRQFVAWTKQGWRPSPACATTAHANLG